MCKSKVLHGCRDVCQQSECEATRGEPWKCEDCRCQNGEFFAQGLACLRCQEIADMLGKLAKTQETHNSIAE